VYEEAAVGPKNALTLGTCRFVNYFVEAKLQRRKLSRRVSQRAEGSIYPREI
jgi:hypothetical protein